MQFPINTGTKEDHPNRVAALVGVDPKYYYKAEELKLYEDAINELANRTAGSTSAANELIEKGFHHIINFDWYAFTQKYKWNGVLYEKPEDLVIATVTIDPAPTTVNFKRFDVIVFNDNFTFSKVKGDEGLNPAIPKIDPRTQLQLTVILVEYGTTEPTYLTKQLMYDEGVGLPAEFAVTKTGASITIGNLEQPSSGLNCIKVANPTNADVLFLDKNVTFNSLDVDTISFKVKNLTAGNWKFYLYSYNSIGGFYQGTALIKNGSYGYNSNNITDYQTIIVPRSKILGTGEVHNTGFAMTFFNNAGGTFFFDEFALNGNFTQALVSSACCDLKEDLSNKKTDIEANKTSNVFYAPIKSFVDWAVGKFQALLVSGTNIKTINGATILGAGDLVIGAGIALGETSATAYRGDRGKTAYDHSQSAHAPTNAQKNSDILKAEIEAKLTGEISSHTHPGGATINADTITTAISITNATTTTGGYAQEGKVILIANGVNVINYTVNAGITASFVKGGTGAITFVQGAGRTLIALNGFVFDGIVGSNASITSFGTVDYLYINNLT